MSIPREHDRGFSAGGAMIFLAELTCNHDRSNKIAFYRVLSYETGCKEPQNFSCSIPVPVARRPVSTKQVTVFESSAGLPVGGQWGGEERQEGCPKVGDSPFERRSPGDCLNKETS